MLWEKFAGLNNLFPFAVKMAVDRRPQLQMFERDFQTPNGTAVRSTSWRGSCGNPAYRPRHPADENTAGAYP